MLGYENCYSGRVDRSKSGYKTLSSHMIHIGRLRNLGAGISNTVPLAAFQT